MTCQLLVYQKMDKNIVYELEKTLHEINSQTLALFREKKFPVSKEQWLILKRISEEEGSSQKDIAKDTFKDPAALTRMLDLLAKKGFVQRKGSKRDRRTFDVYLTVEGNRLVNRIRPILENLNLTVSRKLSARDKTYLFEILAKVQAH